MWMLREKRTPVLDGEIILNVKTPHHIDEGFHDSAFWGF